MGNAKKSKIAFISPYFHILGGGERFLLTIAEFLSENNEVFIFNIDSKLFIQARKRLGINLNKLKASEVFPSSLNLLFKLWGFNCLFYMTDGSLFFSPCFRNYLVIQSPAHIPPKNVVNMIKLSRFNTVICYSNYVAAFIKSNLNKVPLVISPPVLVDKFRPGKKENIILSVGRFFNWIHSKKQEVLITVFKKLYNRNPQFKNWQLILIGSIDEGAKSYFERIKKEAEGFPIKIIPDADFKLLCRYYAKAKIYWHAAGFGEDLFQYPERAEHFGITTVEAMSAGCVPIVFNAGGQKEIVKEAINGFLWNNTEELIKKTENLVKNENIFNLLSSQARHDSQHYSKDKFIRRIKEILDNG